MEHDKMVNRLPALFFKTLIVISALTFTTSCDKTEVKKVMVATSANMQFAIVELERAFEALEGADIEIILGSSGKLTNQIIAGAPYDLFLSADSKFPETLVDKGLVSGRPKTYAFGKLVIWTSMDLNSMEGLTKIALGGIKIAIANPKTAPYGVAALENLKSNGDWEEIKDQVVFGESISQVNQFLLSGAAKVGLTSMSSIKSEAFNDKGSWIDVPVNTYTPIAQQMVILNARPEMYDQAKAFFDFVLSARGQEILSAHGYEPTY
ncbi:molybdate ABC transporter substrate-binding protein [Roseivirga sp. E12]|uniref:molybdate ABC transporter substrate-binding protein n=1 Tax=Roseivirga sp. E12 TaxID=2819237 RepID=UPI001ABD33EE|nr:molybdate ABC transporter substrate-binding protein [Roseivirga sp. E12]MBO3697468.1 molybdate ABC transporter substrate-binding protein [Roseivirga sp. E12]